MNSIYATKRSLLQNITLFRSIIKFYNNFYYEILFSCDCVCVKTSRTFHILHLSFLCLSLTQNGPSSFFAFHFHASVSPREIQVYVGMNN